MDPSSPTDALGLFALLPGEIRTIIYNYLAASHDTIVLERPSTRKLKQTAKISPNTASTFPLAFLHTSTLLRKEYLQAFRKNSRFRLNARDLTAFERLPLARLLLDHASRRTSALGKRKRRPDAELSTTRTPSPLYVDFDFCEKLNRIDLLPVLSFLHRHTNVNPNFDTFTVTDINNWTTLPATMRLLPQGLRFSPPIRECLRREMWKDLLSKGALSEVRASVGPIENTLAPERERFRVCNFHDLHIVVRSRYSEPWMMSTFNVTVPEGWDGLNLRDLPHSDYKHLTFAVLCC